ncbi:FACT complex subunit SSRP1 [Nesidiocoris tenuis]|uniref:Odorant receptor n=1 Tax=Nesidiocoris tenuis TaxID=355587 RepID=A0ABN7B4D6_9HEMI|nr:FACT complex subunit SSRP1 [Nesidiocoris tenuis]
MFRRKAQEKNVAGPKPEVPYVIKDPKEFATNLKIFLWLGYVYDGSLLSKVRISIFMFLVYTAPIHHMIPVFIDKDVSADQILTSVYLIQFYILLGSSWPFMVNSSKDIIEFGKSVQRGVFQYSVPYSDSERRVLSETNDHVKRTTRISLIMYIAAGLITFSKELTPDSFRKFRPPYPGWFPWDINNNTGYAFALLYHFCLAVNTSMALEANFILFGYLTINYQGQFQLLKKHYVETFPPGLSPEEAYTDEHRTWTMNRLKDCIRHHLAIKQFHKMILRYFGVTLFVFRIVSTVMLCIMAYLATTCTDPNKFVQLFGLAAGILLLSIFCLSGETVMQVSEDWRASVYEVDWWIQPVEVQKAILLMQVGSSKPLTIFGIWKVTKFSHEGICVMCQETLGFFNMLRAMK